MSPTKLNIEGKASIAQKAERAVLDIEVTTSGPSRQTVSEEVTTSARHLQEILKTASQFKYSKEKSSKAALAHWSITSLTSNSHQPTDQYNNPIKDGETIYSATVKFDVRVQDFDQLGSFVTRLSALPLVKINNLRWTLTPETRQSFESELRKKALRNAIEQARDYAEVFNAKTIRCTEVSHGGHGGGFFAEGDEEDGGGAGPYRSVQRTFGGASTVDEQLLGDLAFQPEEIKMRLRIDCKFEAGI